VSSRTLTWILRAAWVLLPLTVGPALAEALRGHSDAVRIAASIGVWMAWAIGTVATLVPHPVALTMLRCLAPASVAAGVAAFVATGPSDRALALALLWGVALTVLALMPDAAIVHVNGPAYANERRFPLSIPGALLLGPIELAWALIVGLPATAVLLLAAGQWVLGAIVTLAAAAAMWFLGRALYGLSRRWAVFVPAGFVLHDPMSLAEPVLFRREVIESLGPAPAGTDSLDLTQRALGLAVELILLEKVAMSPGGVEGSSARLLFTPSRPGALLEEAASRHLPIRR
jgi:hypothetical protein